MPDNGACAQRRTETPKRSKSWTPRHEAAVNAPTADHRFDAARPEWRLSQPHARCIEDGVADDRFCPVGRRLAGAVTRMLRSVVDQHHLDRIRYLLEAEDRIAHAVEAGDACIIKPHPFVQRSAQRLDHIPLDLIANPIRIDDQPAVMRDHHPPAFDPTLRRVNRDIGDGRAAWPMGVMADRFGSAPVKVASPLCALLAAGPPAAADALVLPAPTLERAGPMSVA